MHCQGLRELGNSERSFGMDYPSPIGKANIHGLREPSVGFYTHGDRRAQNVVVPQQGK